MAQDESKQKRAPQSYLDADFAKELNYQLWVMKSSRFTASQRLHIKHRWSTYAVTALSIYAIAANLMLAYGLTGDLSRVQTPATSTIAFFSSVMSIAIMVISLLEGSRQYDLRASRFHDCGLAVNQLYRELRQARMGPADPITATQLAEIRRRYEAILERYENHEDVDYLLVQTKKSEWFNRPGIWRTWIYIRWYFSVRFLYHAAIAVPPLIFLWWYN